jgi:hypothetical protein
MRFYIFIDVVCRFKKECPYPTPLPKFTSTCIDLILANIMLKKEMKVLKIGGQESKCKNRKNIQLFWLIVL